METITPLEFLTGFNSWTIVIPALYSWFVRPLWQASLTIFADDTNIFVTSNNANVVEFTINDEPS